MFFVKGKTSKKKEKKKLKPKLVSRYILHSGQSAAYYYSHSALKINAYEKCVLLRVHPSLSLSYSIIFIQQMNEIFQLQLMDFLHYFGFNREVQL